MARTPSPSKRSGSSKKGFVTNTDARHKLRDYGIFINRGEAKPPEVERLIEKLLLPRDKEKQSPNAQKVPVKQPGAVQLKEVDAVNFLRNDLLLLSAKEGGESYIEVSSNENLSRSFLPTTSAPTAGLLEQAQPDTAIGYIREPLANALRIPSPFSLQEDQDLARFQVCSNLHAPFFTCQWKGAKNPNHTVAQNQGARDGAVMVNYMRWVYGTAEPGMEPCTADTCHFSATCDISTIILFVHWSSVDSNGVVTHYMEEIDDLSLKKERDMTIFRTFIRNLQDHALKDRLNTVKAAIPNVSSALAQKPWLLPTPPPETETASASGSVISALPALPPLMPASDAPSSSSSAPAKRKRIGDGDVIK